MMPSKILFVNTFEPVVPLYRDVFPCLEELGVEPVALISTCQYRGDGDIQEGRERALVWVPRCLRARRRWCAIFYYVIVPFRLLLSSSSTRIVFLSQPPLLYVIGSVIARWRGNRYYLHVMDLYPDLLLRLGVFGDGLLSKWVNTASAKAFARAEKVITVGRCMQSVVRDKGVPAEKLLVIENWPEKVVGPDPVGSEEFRKVHGLTDKLVVMYSGNMGRFHSLATILTVARRMQDRSDVAFVFVGQGVRRVEIEEAIADGVNNVVLMGHQPLDMFTTVLNAGDVHFVSLREGFEGLMVPSKFYGVLAAGRPVVYEGSDVGEVARVIVEERCGVVVSPGDVRALEQSLLDYLEDGEKVAEQGARARAAYETRFYPDVLVRRYVDAIMG